jgi:hypothetical protein
LATRRVAVVANVVGLASAFDEDDEQATMHVSATSTLTVADRAVREKVMTL